MIHLTSGACGASVFRFPFGNSSLLVELIRHVIAVAAPWSCHSVAQIICEDYLANTHDGTD